MITALNAIGVKLNTCRWQDAMMAPAHEVVGLITPNSKAAGGNILKLKSHGAVPLDWGLKVAAL